MTIIKSKTNHPLFMPLTPNDDDDANNNNNNNNYYNINNNTNTRLALPFACVQTRRPIICVLHEIARIGPVYYFVRPANNMM